MTRVTTCWGLILPEPTATKKSSFFAMVGLLHDLAQQFRADEPLGGQPLLAEGLEQRLPAQVLGVLPPSRA